MPYLNDPVVQCCGRDAANCDCLVIGRDTFEAIAKFIMDDAQNNMAFSNNYEKIDREQHLARQSVDKEAPGWGARLDKINTRAQKRRLAAARLRNIKRYAIGRAFCDAVDDKIVKYIVSNYWPRYWSEVLEVLDALPATPSQLFAFARRAGYCEVFADAVMGAFRNGLVSPEDFDGDDYLTIASLSTDCHNITQYDDSGTLTFPIWWIEEWADVTYLNEPDAWAPVPRVMHGNFFLVQPGSTASNTTEIYIGGN